MSFGFSAWKTSVCEGGTSTTGAATSRPAKGPLFAVTAAEQTSLLSESSARRKSAVATRASTKWETKSAPPSSPMLAWNWSVPPRTQASPKMAATFPFSCA